MDVSQKLAELEKQRTRVRTGEERIAALDAEIAAARARIADQEREERLARAQAAQPELREATTKAVTLFSELMDAMLAVEAARREITRGGAKPVTGATLFKPSFKRAMRQQLGILLDRKLPDAARDALPSRNNKIAHW